MQNTGEKALSSDEQKVSDDSKAAQEELDKQIQQMEEKMWNVLTEERGAQERRKCSCKVT